MFACGLTEGTRQTVGSDEEQEPAGRAFDALLASVRPAPPRLAELEDPFLYGRGSTVEDSLPRSVLSMFRYHVLGPDALAWEIGTRQVTLRYRSRVPTAKTWQICASTPSTSGRAGRNRSPVKAALPPEQAGCCVATACTSRW